MVEYVEVERSWQTPQGFYKKRATRRLSATIDPCAANVYGKNLDSAPCVAT
jgi:hypothetical protein